MHDSYEMSLVRRICNRTSTTCKVALPSAEFAPSTRSFLHFKTSIISNQTEHSRRAMIQYLNEPRRVDRRLRCGTASFVEVAFSTGKVDTRGKARSEERRVGKGCRYREV